MPVECRQENIIALSGGVGGAKLVLGLSHILAPENLLVIANTGDDFDHFGLRICPDLDTVTYTLADLANKEMGWGRQGETWQFMSVLKDLGGADWFNLGDGDLALHIRRTEMLRAGDDLSFVTREICARFGIGPEIIPMSNDPVATLIDTPDGELAFQEYFVRDRCEPKVSGIRFQGIDRARANSIALEKLADAALDAIIFAPSNPFVSVAPILALPQLRAGIESASAPALAVSPIVDGLAIKGPAAKMMQEMGLPSTALEVARHYQETYPDLLDGFIVDDRDQKFAPEIEALGLKTHVTQTIMKDLADRKQLADACLSFARELV